MKEDPAVPAWSKMAIGLAIAVILLGFAGLRAFQDRAATVVETGPLVQEHGTTYYGSDGPDEPAIACKPESEILAAIDDVHAEFDVYDGDALQEFERRAAHMRGLPPLRVDKLYVITKDDNVQNRDAVLFIGMRKDCVGVVFSFPAKLYAELSADKDV